METIKSIWNFKQVKEHQWFRFVFILLLAVIVIYVISHLSLRFYPDLLREKGYEYDKLTKEQILHIGKIYEADSGRAEYIPTRVGQYIQSEFNGKVETRQLQEIKSHITLLSGMVAMDYLSQVRLKVSSYFWLTGPEVYFEIMFWSLFGVLCSILFNIGNILRNATTDPGKPRTSFDSSEIYSQIAKMIYAPLCTLVIILGYNFFEEGSVADISSSKGILVFSFIGGFYSSRMMAFLDRLKEVILPNSGYVDAAGIKTISASVVKNVRFKLDLEKAGLSEELKTSILNLGLTDARVVLKNIKSGDTSQVTEKVTGEKDVLTVKELPKGGYKVVANWEKEIGTEQVFLTADLEVNIETDGQSVVVPLSRSMENG